MAAALQWHMETGGWWEGGIREESREWVGRTSLYEVYEGGSDSPYSTNIYMLFMRILVVSQ